MIAYILYIMTPFWFAYCLVPEAKRPAVFKVALVFLMTLLILAFGFVSGLVTSFFYQPSKYWKAYDVTFGSANFSYLTDVIITGLTKESEDSNNFWTALFIPFTLLIDVLRIYVIVSIKHWTVALVIWEVISIEIVLRFYIMMGILPKNTMTII